MRKLLIIAGVPIDDMTMPEVLDQISEYIRAGTPHQIATVNADFVLKAWEDPELRQILNQADLLTADGMPLVWGARLLGVHLQGRVAGADLVPALAERGAREGWRFYMLGGREGVAALATEKLTSRYPGFNVVGMYAPPFGPVVEMGPDINERIRAARPDILLVAFGNPKQEKWISMNAADLGVPVMIGVGGSLDFAAGEIPRAPLWMQNTGLEWVFRLIQEPRRMWKRYVLDLVHFTRFFFIQWWRNLFHHGRQLLPDVKPKQPAAPPRPAAQPDRIDKPQDTFQVIYLKGRLTSAERAEVQTQVEKILQVLAEQNGIHRLFQGVRLNLSEVTFIDSAGFGMLVNLTKQARARSMDLRLFGLHPDIQTTLRMIHLEKFLTVENADDTKAPAVVSLSAVGIDWNNSGMEKEWLIVPMPARLEGMASRILPAEIEKFAPLAKYLVADFKETTFVDSSGVAALLQVQKRLRAAGGELRLAALGVDTRRVLDLSGVARMFTIYQTANGATMLAPDSPENSPADALKEPK